MAAPLVALGALAVALVACRSKRNTYPETVVENFLRACQSRASESACRCAIDRIQERYTAEQYEMIEAGIRAGAQPPQAFVDVATECGTAGR